MLVDRCRPMPRCYPSPTAGTRNGPNLHTSLTPAARPAPTARHGTGTVAVAPIAAGSVVATFGGTATDWKGLAVVDASRRARSLQVDDDRFLVGPPDAEPGEQVNHSCAPTCRFRNAVQLVAARDLVPGDELTYDYATTDTAPYDEFECRCGHRSCRGRVRADDWTDAGLRVRRSGWFAPHVERRIRDLVRARPLGKRDVAALLDAYDRDPVAALEVALRICTGFAHGDWPRLVARLDPRLERRAGLLARETSALDWLAGWLNEARTAPGHPPIDRRSD